VILAKATIKSHTDTVILSNSPRFQTYTKPSIVKISNDKKIVSAKEHNDWFETRNQQIFKTSI